MIQKHLNLNTLLLIIVGALVTVTINKADHLNTQSIQNATEVGQIKEEMKQIKNDGQVFQQQITELKLADKAMQDEIRSIKHQP